MLSPCSISWDSSEDEDRIVLYFENSKLVCERAWTPDDMQNLVDHTVFDYYGDDGFKELYEKGFSSSEIEKICNDMEHHFW